jgi:hypothetical protein
MIKIKKHIKFSIMPKRQKLKKIAPGEDLTSLTPEAIFIQ